MIDQSHIAPSEEIRFSITMDELRIDPARLIEFHGLYADAILGDLALNQVGAWLNEVHCIFIYTSLPPGFIGPRDLRQEMLEKLREIAAPMMSSVH